MIIMITGLKGSGKSTLAKLIAKEAANEYIRKSFAEPLYRMVEALLVYQGATKDEIHYLFNEGKEEPTPYLEGKTVRYALQTLGTEWGRVLISKNIWVNVARRSIGKYPNVVFDDLRFLNEDDMKKNLNGISVRVERPGVELDPHHISELEQLRIIVDYTIVNDGESIDMLKELESLVGEKI
jgi:AAA+ ATPase superfamily predicted ATPase